MSLGGNFSFRCHHQLPATVTASQSASGSLQWWILCSKAVLGEGKEPAGVCVGTAVEASPESGLGDVPPGVAVTSDPTPVLHGHSKGLRTICILGGTVAVLEEYLSALLKAIMRE